MPRSYTPIHLLADTLGPRQDAAKTLIKELLPTLSPANRKIRGYWKETDE
jgi:hypothetical protein